MFAVQMLFCSTNDIFLVCSTNFGASFCRLIAPVLLPYVKFLKHSTKVCCIFLGVVHHGGVKAPYGQPAAINNHILCLSCPPKQDLQDKIW